MDEKRKRKAIKMVGEFLREVGVLVTVFGPLEAALTGHLTLGVIAGTLGVAGFCLGFGFWFGLLEGRKK
jgi:hypothetical protein